MQAASRCLRQIPGNSHKASIYLSQDNQNTLDRELAETYGTSIAELNQAKSKSRSAIIRLRKIKMPPIVVKQIIRSVIRKTPENSALSLTKPAATQAPKLERHTFEITQQSATRSLLKQISHSVQIKSEPDALDLYTAAVELASVYRLDLWQVHGELTLLLPDAKGVPTHHFTDLAAQIENQVCNYEMREEMVEVALALVKTDGFDCEVNADGVEFYTAEITYPIDREPLLLKYNEWREKWDGKAAAFGFHYDPYNTDSNPEKSFFELLLEHIGLHPDKVEDIYFTGAITDPRKTDFFVEYKDEDGKWHRYTPDFIIRRKDGKCLIVEIKAERDRNHPVNGEKGGKAMALRRWENLDPDRLKYQMIFVDGNTVPHDQTQTARKFVED